MAEEAAEVVLPTGTVTFLFSDMEGSTELLDRLGPSYGSVLRRHHEIVRHAIRTHHGVEVSVAGDGFFVAFARASDAVAAAVEIQLELGREEWPPGVDVRVRIGIHAGEAEVVDDHYLGMAIHEAARISAAGHGGQVLVSSRTLGLAEGSLPRDLSADDLGPHRLKGIPDPVAILQLVHPDLRRSFPPIRTSDGPRPTRLPEDPTPLMAREALVQGVTERIDAGARLVTLLGPGGIGKTRVSVAVARACASCGDEAWFAALAPIDAAAVLTAVARAVGADLQGEVGVEESIVRTLGTRRGLLVLDNFEHVLAAAPLVGRLLDRLSDVTVLVTSREPLHLAAEVQVVVPLSVRDRCARGRRSDHESLFGGLGLGLVLLVGPFGWGGAAPCSRGGGECRTGACRPERSTGPWAGRGDGGRVHRPSRHGSRQSGTAAGRAPLGPRGDPSSRSGARVVPPCAAARASPAWVWRC